MVFNSELFTDLTKVVDIFFKTLSLKYTVYGIAKKLIYYFFLNLCQIKTTYTEVWDSFWQWGCIQEGGSWS